MNSVRAAGGVGLALLLVFPWLPLNSSWLTTMTYIGLYAIPVLGIVLITGTAGMLSFGQASFMGIGAYTTAVMSSQYGLNPFFGLVAGWLLSGISAWVLSAVTARMSGHYLPIATLAWGIALFIVFANSDSLGRNDGISGINPVELGGASITSQSGIYYLVWLVALIALLLVRNLLDSQPGRAIRALASGQIMPESMGIDSAKMKRTVFIVAALLASTSGWLYAHMIRAISPSAFGAHYSLEMVFMAVIGGVSSIGGAFLGSAIVVIGKDLLQSWLPKLLPVSGSFESIVFGIAMVALLIKAKSGAWPALRRLLPAKAGQAIRKAVDAEPTTRVTPGHLVVDAIVKRFGGLTAVNGANLEVKPGEIIALIGPNGAGKSTTFNLISGVLSPDEGRVSYNGRPLTAVKAREVAHRKILRTFQHVKLVPGMSVLENVAIGAHMRQRPSVLRSMLRLDRDAEQLLLSVAAASCERVGLGHFLHDEATSLSLGQQRLVEIARALCASPSLLLLDEPAAGLRFAEKQALATLIKQLQSEGTGVLLVEHDMPFVMNLVDRIYVLDFGTPIAEGLPAEIQANSAVRRAYLGSE